MADRKKKRSTDDSDEFLKDSYDMSVFAGRHDICAMCKGGYNMGLSLIRNFSLTDEDDADEDQTTLANSILDLDGVWASKYGIRISKTRSVFVHFHCAHYSPRSWFDGANWYNLGKEVVRSGCLACSHCGRKGASLGCSVKKCKNVMHIPCAIQSGYGRNNLRGRYYCITHTKQREKDEIKEDEEYMQDLSNGKEPIPILFPRRHRADPMIAQIFDDFEYTMQNLDSDDVSAKSEGVGSLACCTCEGLCDDVATCACLQEGKNYTYQGTAIPGLTRPIIECNLKCACSIRRCTNRVVERGLTHKLELFKFPAYNRTYDTVDGCVVEQSPMYQSNLKDVETHTVTIPEHWGIRTLEKIPANAFICEVTGQYVLGKSMVVKKFDGTGNKEFDTVQGKVVEDLFSGNCDNIIVIDQWTSKEALNPYDWAIQELESEGKKIKFEEDPDGFLRRATPECSPVVVKSLARPATATVYTTRITSKKQRLTDDDNNIDSSNKASLVTSKIADEDDEHSEESEYVYASTIPLSKIDLYSEEREQITSLTILKKKELDIKNLLSEKLCLDCRHFSNVARFMRKRESFEKIIVKKKQIYTNAKNKKYPKLALFAAEEIPEMTEIYL